MRAGPARRDDRTHDPRALPLLAAEIAGLSPGQIGGIYSASVLVLLVVGPLAGLAADRFGAMPLTGARAVANTLSSLLYLVFPTAAAC